MIFLPVFEYSIYLRWIRNDGQSGPLVRRYFPTARLALTFLARLDSDTHAAYTLARREVGTWEFVDRLALETDVAASEGAR